MEFNKLVKGRCYEDANCNSYIFDGYQSSTEAMMVVMEYDKKDDCYYSTDKVVIMDKFDVLDLVW